MRNEVADLVNLQELYEIAGPSVFNDSFDADTFLLSITNEDGVLVPTRFDFASYIPKEISISIKEVNESFGMTQDYYEKIERFNEGYFENLKVAHTENFFNEQEDFSILSDNGEVIKVFGDFHGVQIGDNVFGASSIGEYGGSIETSSTGKNLYKEFFSEKVPLSHEFILLPERELYAGNTFVEFDFEDSSNESMIHARTFDGDDVIDGLGGSSSFIDGGAGVDLVTVEVDHSLEGNIRVFGDFGLINGLDDNRSHILFDIEKIQIVDPEQVRTFNIENLGPSLDGGSYAFYEDIYTKEDNFSEIPESFAQNHFVIPASVSNFSPSNVINLTFISKKFDDIKNDNAKDNRKSIELEGTFSYLGSSGFDESGGLLELPEVSGLVSRSDEYFGEFFISSERYYSPLYQELPFQDIFFDNGMWKQENYHGNDGFFSLNGIANAGWDINENSGLDFYTGFNDYIYSYSGNDYIFGGVGDDFIDGGLGKDTAIYIGKSSNYTIRRNDDGSYTVSDNLGGYPSDGIDTLFNIESLSFADKDIALGSENSIQTVVSSESLNSLSSLKIDVAENLESFQSVLDSVLTLPSFISKSTALIESSDVTAIISPSSLVINDTLIEVEESTESMESSSEQLQFTVNSTDEIFTATSTKTKLEISRNISDFTIEKDGTSWKISGSDIGTDTLSGFKRIEFDDGILALDVDAGDTAGQAYRLYQAAFARTPDMPGVSYHMNDIEGNGLALENVANNFIASPEFKTKYGDNPSDDVFIDLLYQNVLGRAADDDGLSFYKNHFNEGTMTRAAALIGFAESPENVNLVAPQIEDGIWLAN